MTAAGLIAGASVLLAALGLLIAGVVWNCKAKRSGTVHTHTPGEPLRPELDGLPSDLMSDARFRTEIP